MYLIISSLSHINECFFAKITHGVLLRAGTKYTVSVFGVFDGGESMPLAGEEKTTLSDGPEPPPYEATGNAFSQAPPTYNNTTTSKTGICCYTGKATPRLWE